MRVQTGTTDGTNFIKTSEIDIAFDKTCASSLVKTIQIEEYAFQRTTEGVKTILFLGKIYEFCQSISTIYGNRPIFVRRQSAGLWTPWIWTGFNSESGIDKWDICEYKGYICLMYIKNNLDMVVAYTQDAETWNESIVLTTNTALMTCCQFSDYIYFIAVENGVYKIGYTDLFTTNKFNYTAINYAQITIRQAYNKILIFDAYNVGSSYVQTYDGISTFSTWTNLGFLTDSYVETSWILGKLYITWRQNITSYPVLANLPNTLAIGSTVVIQNFYTEAIWVPMFIFNGKVYVGYLRTDQYNYRIADASNFPNFGESRIVETNFISVNPGVICDSEQELDPILYVPITKNINKYYRFIEKKKIKYTRGYYYELELWTYFGDHTLCLKNQKYSNHEFINSRIL